MIELEAATLLLGWAAGGWLLLWVTTRRREVGLGYGWLMRGIFLALAAGSLVAAFATEPTWSREAVTLVFIVAGLIAAAVSVVRRSAGTAGRRATVERRSARVAGMTGIDRAEPRPEAEPVGGRIRLTRARLWALFRGFGRPVSAANKRGRHPPPTRRALTRPRGRYDDSAPEFPPFLDLTAAVAGLLATLLGALAAEGPAPLAVVRTLVGALFTGAVLSAMLLGHWYLVQPGLARGPLLQMVRAAGLLWLAETVVLLWPTGMASVLDGTIDDGYNGLLGWFWVGCTATTLLLVAVARAALRERQYSAVMAATGLVYLAIVTAFGQDLVARILLAP